MMHVLKDSERPPLNSKDVHIAIFISEERLQGIQEVLTAEWVDHFDRAYISPTSPHPGLYIFSNCSDHIMGYLHTKI